MKSASFSPFGVPRTRGQALLLPQGTTSGQDGPEISPTGAPMSPLDAIRRHQAELTAFRRDLHAHPELGMAEFRTAEKVASALESVREHSYF